ncbi:MAG: response regulator [Rhodospirillales bacterium]
MTISPEILIADDEPAIGEIIVEVAAGCGVRAKAFQTAEALLAEYHPGTSAIFIDLHMPDMDGIELIERLQSLGCTSDLVLISGQSTQMLEITHNLGTAKGLRMVKILSKPFEIEQLETLIQEISCSPTVYAPSLPTPFLNDGLAGKILKAG